MSLRNQNNKSSSNTHNQINSNYNNENNNLTFNYHVKEAYLLTHNLRLIFTQTKDKGVAYTKLARWYKSVEETGFKAFTSIKNTMQSHYQGILNYFDNRSTNASAEFFNAKLKAFRSALRGVRDINFFLFRVAKIYA